MPYSYVGPRELLATVRPGGAGAAVTSQSDLERFLRTQDPDEPVTFVVDTTGTLRLAPRRREHVACAGGGPVLSAGEMRFEERRGGWQISEVSNQSTGYCPDTASWPDVAEAADRAGLTHPGGFTISFVFRHCPACGELNVVKDDWYVCVFCDAGLDA